MPSGLSSRPRRAQLGSPASHVTDSLTKTKSAASPSWRKEYVTTLLSRKDIYRIQTVEVNINEVRVV